MVYQEGSLFFLFCIYDNVICKVEVGNESSPDADTTGSYPAPLPSPTTQIEQKYFALIF